MLSIPIFLCYCFASAFGRMVFSELEKKFPTSTGISDQDVRGFYAYANLQYLWLLLFSCLIGWLLSCLPEKISSEKGKKLLTASMFFHLGLLGLFKVQQFFPGKSEYSISYGLSDAADPAAGWNQFLHVSTAGIPD